MKLFICFTAVVLISCLVWETNTEMVKRANLNLLEVTDDWSNDRAGRLIKSSHKMVQFFAFSRLAWDLAVTDIKKASTANLFTNFLLYNCADKPQYCPSDVTKTSYRFYGIYHVLKKTVEDIPPYLAYWEIRNIVNNL